jgi:hypothetical protein
VIDRRDELGRIVGEFLCFFLVEPGDDKVCFMVFCVGRSDVNEQTVPVWHPDIAEAIEVL